MSPMKRMLLGVAMTLATVATAFPQYEGASRSDSYRSDGDVERNGYSYVRETVGGVTVQSRWNGRVTARRNMPISAGDEILVSDAGRAEIGLADGNLLFVGGGTRARFSSLYAQQGEDDDFSAIDLREGSVVLAAMGYDDNSIPRIDTEDATVYLSAGTRVRVNADPRRGTVVVVRSGSAEVRTRNDSYTVEAGQYMMVEGDEPPEIARGVFSRDRFDLWASDRLENLTVVASRSESVQYVDDDYSSEVVALDDYGDWEYSSTYSTNVWVPRVSVGWSPYSHGSWYYTPVGLSWWSYDPWGWYPHHYGSWYFDVGFRHWCWVPSYTYSPAWVYWAYTPSYVGWCPVGYYSFYSPWYDNYYRHWGWNPRYNRAGLMFALSGTFRKSQIDLGGWNFTAAGTFGSSFDRLDVVPGSRIASHLNDQIAISGKPIVLSSRGESLPRSLQNYVKQAPSLIQRTSPDGSRLAPVLARDKTLSASTLEVLKDRAVVAGRGKLAGPGAEELAARGTVVDRGRSIKDALNARGLEKRRDEAGADFSRGRKAAPGRVGGGESAREAPGVIGSEAGDVWRGRGVEKREKAERVAPEAAPATGDWRGRGVEKREKAERVAPQAAPATGDWRGRGVEKREKAERVAPEAAPREKSIDRSAPRGNDDWRGRAPSSKRQAAPSVEAPAPRSKPGKQVSREGDWRGRADRFEGNTAAEVRSGDWRRSNDPPAKRVIEGAVPGRRGQAQMEAPRAKERARDTEWRLRAPEQPAPAPRSYGYERKEYRAPAPQREPRPEFRAPAPQREYRQYEPRQAEPRQYKAPREYRPEYRSQPAPRAPQYSAPRESRPAPAPNPGFKSHGKGRKG